ncbi:conserved hypothetical protein [Gammaproteobacteria bacterium]
MNHFKIPLCNPFKFVPITDAPGIHFDDNWFIEQIRYFEMKSFYRQKWVKSNTTKIQVESSIAPQSIKVIDRYNNQIKVFNWVAVYTAINYSIYETTFDVTDVSEKIIFLKFGVVFEESINWSILSEPIEIKTEWPGTMLFRYNNSYNKFDVAFSTGIKFYFRCEAVIHDFYPERGGTDYINQVKDTELLEVTPSRKFKLSIGCNMIVGARLGVAPWVLDIVNRILCCDIVSVENMRYCAEAEAKWEKHKQGQYPLIGGTIDIVPSFNSQSLEFADTTPLAPGLVLAYNIDTAIFAPGSIVPINEVLINS